MIVLCSKCHRPNDRAPHRYCSRCHAGYMRTWRNPMRLAMIQFNAGLAIFHLAAWILRQDNPMLRTLAVAASYSIYDLAKKPDDPKLQRRARVDVETLRLVVAQRIAV